VEQTESQEKLIVGLGNPGRSYEHTRHNLGFLVVDRVAESLEAPRWQEEGAVAVTAATVDETKVWLLKPLTYMNLSGPPVAGLARYYKIPNEKVLLVVDDVAIPFGRLRLRAEGTAGGHNGLKSVIAALGSTSFPRLRIGIGPVPPQMDMADFVLEKLSKSEMETLDSVLDRAVEAVRLWRTQGVAAAANAVNAPTVEGEKKEE